MDALMLPSNWQQVRLGDILSYEQPTKYLVATTQYLQKGFTPILTAGKTFILGYTNDKHGIYTNIPVIIFDDFTTDSKMVNFPFKVKSSAIKILSLRDNNQADLKYIYEKLTLLKHQVTDHKRYWIDEFSNIEIPLPPLNEQSAITDILSALDNYLHALRALILKKESVKKALSFELLSQRKRLKGFNQAWQQVRLGTYKYRRGSFPQPYGNPQWYSDNGMPFVQVYDVGENFKLTQRTKQKISKIAQPMSVFVPKNSVIITLQGTIGRVALTQYDCYCDRTILIFDNNTLNDVNKYFFVLSLFTKFEEEKRKADGSIIKTITKQTLKDFEIPLPPLNEQSAIADILSALDKEIASLKNKKRQFENIKKALNHDLMSAKIRVFKK
ncbi:restriction endonuclease subunit S [Helicobacter pylori]|uniref:restriction endonuclease subunit S n=1 Tax=Helicobacter pylori TaxID=210 RepID=UPI000C3180DB|nr:restriction endonuclease subunit S [Helicobacter pylori]